MGAGGSAPVMAPISSDLEEAKKAIIRRSKRMGITVPRFSHPALPQRQQQSSEGSTADSAAAEDTFYVYGHTANHKIFLEPGIAEMLLPFLNGPSYYTALGVSRHWFIALYDAFLRRCEAVVNGFKKTYSNNLAFQTALVDIQPIFTAETSMRVDLLLYAKVLGRCSNRCCQIGYSYRYLSPTPTVHEAVGPMGPSFDENRHGSSDYDQYSRASSESPKHRLTKHGKILVPTSSSYGRGRDAPQSYECSFRFDAYPQSHSRTLWIHKDICRFHGDEIMVAFLPTIPSLCAGDVVEVAINICNGFGVVDVENLLWTPLKFAGGSGLNKGRTCEIENQFKLWHDMETFQQSTTETLSNNDLFGPQWKLIKTEFAGVDITCSRSAFKAVETGDVPRSRELLNLNYHVVPKGTAIVCPLKRHGMQHDRFTRQWVRMGDSIVLYISQGGGIA